MHGVVSHGLRRIHRHHRGIRVDHQASTNLLAIGGSTTRSLGCEQTSSAHQGNLIFREAKRHFEVVFHHLIVMKLEIGADQLAALNSL